MRHLALVALFAVLACEKPGPGPTTVNNWQQPRPPAPAGSFAVQASTELRRDVRADDVAARLRQVEPGSSRSVGEPGYAPYDVGAAGSLGPQPQQESPVFQGLRERLQ